MTPLIAFKPIPTREQSEQLLIIRLERWPSTAQGIPLTVGFCASNIMVLVDSAESQFLECCPLSTLHSYFVAFIDSILGFFLFLFSFVAFLFFAIVGPFVGPFVFFVLNTVVNCFVIAFPVPSNFNGKKLYPGG